jgi:putative oxidoreductase
MDKMLQTHGAMVGRMLIGLLFLFSGANILLSGSINGTASMIESVGFPMALILAWVVVAVKIIGGGALMVGYETKKATLALMGFLVITIVFFHFDVNDIQLFKNLAIMGGLFYVYVYGPGEGWKLG